LQTLRTKSTQFNLNKNNICLEDFRSLQSDQDDKDEYEDCSEGTDDGEEVEENGLGLLEQCRSYREASLYRYHYVVPADVSVLLNKGKKAKSPPSPLITYLIFSNIASFLHYCRLWNGALYVDEQDAMPSAEAQQVCKALLTQLLSKDSQEKVKKDPLTSAYFLDHLYYLALFKDFQGFEERTNKVLLSSKQRSLKSEQQVGMQDLCLFYRADAGILQNKEEAVCRTKSNLVEALLRYYDFINDVESSIVAKKAQMRQ